MLWHVWTELWVHCMCYCQGHRIELAGVIKTMI